MYIWEPLEPREDLGFPGAGVIGGVDVWELDAGSAGRAGSILNH